MTDSVFNLYSRYYDLLYRDKDYAAEVAYIIDRLTQHGVMGSALLEFGSGTGQHGRLLAERGFRVTGIERSAEMVAKAQSVPGFTCQQGDICTVQLGRNFDAVLSLFHVVSYQTTNTAVQAVFARAAAHLQSGGLLLFDIWYSPAVYAQRPAVRVKRMADAAVEVTRIAEPKLYPNGNRVDVHYNFFIRDKIGGAIEIVTETHPLRHFSLPELNLFAQMAGFECVGAEEFLTGKAPSGDTWSVCIIMKKKP